MLKGLLVWCTLVLLGLSQNVTKDDDVLSSLLFNQTLPLRIEQILPWKPGSDLMGTMPLIGSSELKIGQENHGCLNTISFCAKEYLFDMDGQAVDLKDFIRTAQRNQRQLAWIMRQLAAYIRRKQKNNKLL